MTILANGFVTANTNPRRHKAPKGFQYNVKGVLFANDTIGNNHCVVVDYLVEDDQNVLSFDDFIAIFQTDANGNLMVTDIDHNTKFLTVGFIGSTASTVQYVIYGELIPITKTQAIIEWFRKGR